MKYISVAISITIFVLLLPYAPAWSVRDMLFPSSGSSFGKSQQPKYQIGAVQPTELTKTVKATGTLNPSVKAEVGSQLSGQIAVLFADFNDVVKEGQVLAQLDESTFKSQVEAAKAQLANAKAEERIVAARLARAQIDVRQAQSQKPILQARVEQQQSTLDMAVREEGRKNILGERGVVAARDVVDSGSRRQVALAALHEAQAILAANATAVEATRADLIRIQEESAGASALVEKAQAQLDSAYVDLDRTKIKSPIDGVVIARNITTGATVASSLEAKTLFMIAQDLRRMKIYALVDETDIAKIAVGQNATFTVDAFPGRQFPAKVILIRKAAEVVQNVVTYTVELEARNDDYALLPGMTVLASIVTEHTPVSLSVPLAALRFHPDASRSLVTADESSQSVWVLRDQIPVRVSVATGRDDGDRVEIKSGDIVPGDKVIVGTGKSRQERLANLKGPAG